MLPSERIDAIRQRLGEATARCPGPFSVQLWPAREFPADAEAALRVGDGEVVLSLMGSEAFVALGAHAPADIEFLLGQVAYWERTAAQIDEALGAKIERIAGERDGARALIARMLPLVDHDSRAGCPMAFHRSDGEQCTCGALDVVAAARALLAGEASRA